MEESDHAPANGARLKRFPLVILGLLALAGMAAVHLAAEPFSLVLRNQVFDKFQRLQPRERQDGAVTIVAIDEKCLKRFGQWPWPRRVHADLIHRLADLGVGLIAFDAVFAEPDRNGPENDKALERALAANRVVLGRFGARPGETARPPKVAVHGELSLFTVPPVGSVGSNLGIFEEAASGAGSVMFLLDDDGLTRSVPGVFRDGGILVPSFAMEVLRAGTGKATILATVRQGMVSEIGITKGLYLPTDGHGRVYPHFARNEQWTYLSAVDVIDGKVHRDQMKGRIVFIGASASGLHDAKLTPLGEMVPGVTVHAEVVEGALSGSLLHRRANARAEELLLAVALGLGLVVATTFLAPRWSLGLWCGFLAAPWAISGAAFFQERVLFDPVPASTVLVAVYLVMTVARLILAERQGPGP